MHGRESTTIVLFGFWGNQQYLVVFFVWGFLARVVVVKRKKVGLMWSELCGMDWLIIHYRFKRFLNRNEFCFM